MSVQSSKHLSDPLQLTHSSSHYFIVHQAESWSQSNADGYNLMTDCVCIYNAQRKRSLPLFHRRLNELPCCLSFPFFLLLLFAILFWSQSSDTCPEKAMGKRDTLTTSAGRLETFRRLCVLWLVCANESESYFKWLWRYTRQTRCF